MTNRTAMIAKVHVAKRDLALTDDSYRAILEKVTGKASAGALSTAELDQVLRHFASLGWKPKVRASRKRGGGRNFDPSPQAAKARALWLGLYQLGVVRDSGESALAAYVKRMTGVDDLRFARPDALRRLIEALKQWCSREGWHASEDQVMSEVLLLRAQWDKLHALGECAGGEWALDGWASRAVSPCSTTVAHLTSEQRLEATRKLGAWIRRVQARQETIHEQA